MADRRKKTLAKAGSRGTNENEMAAKHRERSKAPVKERFNFVHEAWWLCSKINVIVTDVLILQQDF